MERAAGLAYDDTAQAKLDKLDVTLAQTSTSKEDAALFAEVLSLANDGRTRGRETTGRASTNGACYGVPLYRQYFSASESTHWWKNGCTANANTQFAGDVRTHVTG